MCAARGLGYVVPMGRRLSVKSAVVVAVILGVVVQPAISASAFDGIIQERCSPVTAQYSRDHWQYGTFSLCARKQGSTIFFTVRTNELQYHWGGAWYYNKRHASVVTRLAMKRDGSVVDVQAVSVNAWSKHAVAQGTFVASAPGFYALIAQVDVTGMYWSSTPGSAVLNVPITLELVVA